MTYEESIQTAFHGCNELLRHYGVAVSRDPRVTVMISPAENKATLTITAEGEEIKTLSMDLPENWLAEIIRKETEGLPA